MAKRKTKLEYKIENAWCDWVEEEYKDYALIALKFAPLGRNGYPDRIVFLPRGRVFLIEFKREGEEPRALQIWKHKQLKRLNHVVWVSDNLEKAKRQFRKAFAEAIGK